MAGSDDEKIRFACPHCGKRHTASVEDAGKEGRCKRCRQKIRVPLMQEVNREGAAPEGDHPDHPVIKCPDCGARLVVLAEHLNKPMLRCRLCRSEFLNMFNPENAKEASETDEVDSPGSRPRNKIERGRVEERKQIFGKRQ